jgi:hypothetical protein
MMNETVMGSATKADYNSKHTSSTIKTHNCKGYTATLHDETVTVGSITNGLTSRSNSAMRMTAALQSAAVSLALVKLLETNNKASSSSLPIAWYHKRHRQE